MSSETSTYSVLPTVAVGLVAGLAATLVTNLAQGPLKKVTPDRVDRHEKRVRPGASSSLVAARKINRVGEFNATAAHEKSAGKVIHLATGIAWGPVYGLLRQFGGLRPFNAALASGAGMSLILDELLVPALGLSAPSQHYPLFTRARGVVAHLVYGAIVSLADEGLGRLALGLKTY